MTRILPFLSICFLATACAHAPVDSRTPAALSKATGPACSLLSLKTMWTQRQGPAYRPIYRIAAPDLGTQFFTPSHDDCARVGFIGDDTPEAYVPVDPETNEPKIECRVYVGPPPVMPADDSHQTPLYTVADRRSGYTIQTLDDEGCLMQDFVIQGLAGYVK